jgi:hypothetical protein
MNPAGAGLQLAAAVGSAAVMTVGVAWFDWPSFTVLALYWLENVIIGGFTLVRILAAGARTERYVESLATGAFFTVHYGLFCLGHGVFVATLFGGIASRHGLFDPVLLMVGRVAGDRIGALVVGAMVVAAALDAWQGARAAANDGRDVFRRLMGAPYGRIVVLHVVLLGSGFLMQALQLPSLAALLLVAFKLAYDLRRIRQSLAQH